MNVIIISGMGAIGKYIKTLGLPSSVQCGNTGSLKIIFRYFNYFVSQILCRATIGTGAGEGSTFASIKSTLSFSCEACRMAQGMCLRREFSAKSYLEREKMLYNFDVARNFKNMQSRNLLVPKGDRDTYWRKSTVALTSVHGITEIKSWQHFMMRY